MHGRRQGVGKHVQSEVKHQTRTVPATAGRGAGSTEKRVLTVQQPLSACLPVRLSLSQVLTWKLQAAFVLVEFCVVRNMIP